MRASAPNFCQLPEAKNAVPTADCVSAEQSQVGKLVCSSISHLSLLVTVDHPLHLCLLL